MKNKERDIIRALFLKAGIEINGKNPCDITIHNNRFYKRVLKEGALGLGESYVDGWWDCDALDQFIFKIIKADVEKEVRGNWKLLLRILRIRLFNMQKIGRASCRERV